MLSSAKKRRMAIKDLTIAAAILLAFLIFGNGALNYMGIKLPALHTAGRILLLLIIIKMMFADLSATRRPKMKTERRARKTMSPSFAWQRH